MKHERHGVVPPFRERVQLFGAWLLALALNGAWMAWGLLLLPVAATTKVLNTVRTRHA